MLYTFTIEVDDQLDCPECGERFMLGFDRVVMMVGCCKGCGVELCLDVPEGEDGCSSIQ